MPSQNEAFSRILIDKALESSDWDLLDPQQMRFELSERNWYAAALNRRFVILVPGQKGASLSGSVSYAGRWCCNRP